LQGANDFGIDEAVSLSSPGFFPFLSPSKKPRAHSNSAPNNAFDAPTLPVVDAPTQEISEAFHGPSYHFFSLRKISVAFCFCDSPSQGPS
jgi:hypothetical protein